MARRAVGHVVLLRGKPYARVTVGKDKRQAFALGCSAAEAKQRTEELNTLAQRLRDAGQESIAANILEPYAAATKTAELAELRQLV